jgi:hypothetical protein
MRATAGLVAQAFQHAFQRVQAGVVDHQLALVAAPVLHRDLAAQGFRQFTLQRGDVGLLRARPGRGLLRLGHLAGGQLLHPVLHLAHRPAFLRGLARQRDRHRRGQRQQRARVAHLQRPGLHQRADLGRQLQQAQQVAHRRARAAHRLGGGGVGEVELVDQPLQRLRLLQRVEVLALDVLDQRHRHHGAVVDHPHHHRHLGQARALAGAPAALAGDDLVGAPALAVRAALLAHHDRLDHALRADRGGQLLQLGVVHGPPRLELARHHGVHRQRAQLVARHRRLQRRGLGGGLRPQQRFQSTAQAALLRPALGGGIAGRHAAFSFACFCSRSRWRRRTSPARPR